MASIFQGSPNVTSTAGTSSTAVPNWLTDAIYNQVQTAQNVAQMPYMPYTGERVAPLDPMQQRAYEAVGSAAGSWAQPMGAAMSGLQALAAAPGGAAAAQPYLAAGLAADPTAAARGYLDQQTAALGGMNYGGGAAAAAQASAAANRNLAANAQPYWDQAVASGGGTTAAQPFANQATGALSAINYGQAAQTLSPYAQQSLQRSGLDVAQPFLERAGATSAQNIQQYMNPYIEGVTDRIAQLGARNLSEQLLPNVSDAFIKAGQFGGTRMGEFGSRALRDTQEAVLGEQAKALREGYGQALTTSAADLARMGQLGATAGQLGTAEQTAILNAGRALSDAQATAAGQQIQGAGIYGNLANVMGGFGQQQAGLLANIGTQAGQLSAEQMRGAIQAAGIGQQAAANELQARLSAAGQIGEAGRTMGQLGVAQQNALLNAGQTYGQLSGADMTRQAGALTSLADMAKSGQQMTTADIAMLTGAGGMMQQQQQRELDIPYSEYLAEQAYPRSALDWLSNQLRGTTSAVPTTTTTSGTGTGQTYSPSPASTFTTALALINGITGSGSGTKSTSTLDDIRKLLGI